MAPEKNFDTSSGTSSTVRLPASTPVRLLGTGVDRIVSLAATVSIRLGSSRSAVQSASQIFASGTSQFSFRLAGDSELWASTGSASVVAIQTVDLGPGA